MAAENKKRPRNKKADLYTVEGDSLKRKGRFCPKCGPGVFMASHKDGRFSCGKCGFMEK